MKQGHLLEVSGLQLELLHVIIYCYSACLIDCYIYVVHKVTFSSKYCVCVYLIIEARAYLHQIPRLALYTMSPSLMSLRYQMSPCSVLTRASRHNKMKESHLEQGGRAVVVNESTWYYPSARFNPSQLPGSERQSGLHNDANLLL